MSTAAAEAAVRGVAPRASRPRHGERVFVAVAASTCLLAALGTVGWCAAMSAMAGMPMPGGWTMSMAWMRMPGQTWLGAGASFVGMWVLMMVAMMLPSLVPMLRRYRAAVDELDGARRGRLTAIVGVAYFVVWTAVGIAVYPLGVALAALAMREAAFARVVPLAVGAVVLSAGLCQLGAWKARHLACCRAMPGAGRRLAADLDTAWRHGLALGRHCTGCCAALTAVLLVAGVMDLGVMAAVTAAVTAERVAPAGERVARVVGLVLVGLGLALVARAVGLA